jgi:hypothetical protein
MRRKRIDYGDAARVLLDARERVPGRPHRVVILFVMKRLRADLDRSGEVGNCSVKIASVGFPGSLFEVFVGGA